MKRNNKKGFTIVELVIVIAVIAILAAVLIPTFSGVIEKANKSSAMQAARNEYELYLAENAESLTGKENFVIVTDKYAFEVENGQFKAEAKEKASSYAGRDLSKVVKSAKVATANTAPNITDNAGEGFYTTAKCETAATFTSAAVDTVVYYVSTSDLGNANVAIYKAN